MEVTRDNFELLMPSIEASINNSLFIAIQGENTGLEELPGDFLMNNYDTPNDIYRRLRYNSFKYLLVRLGLAIFSYDHKTDTYEYSSYTFYLFPPTTPFETRRKKGIVFSSQTRTIDRMSRNNFNFNALFYKGIPYLNRDQQRMENQAMKIYQRVRKLQISKTVTNETNRFSRKMALMTNLVDAFLNCTDPESPEIITLPFLFLNERIATFVFLIETYRGKGLYFSIDAGQIAVKKNVTFEEIEELERERDISENAEFFEAVGFSQLMDKIVASRKPVVGYHLLPDLCHIVQSFLIPLPASYKWFKKTIRWAFPTTVDLGHLLHSKPLSDLIKYSTIQDVYERLNSPPFKRISAVSVFGKEYDISTDFMTSDLGSYAVLIGMCYQTIANYLGSLNNAKSIPVDANDIALQNYTNKIQLPKLYKSYMEIYQDDPVMERDHIFYVEHSAHLSTASIAGLFKYYGGASVIRRGPTAAFVVLLDKSFTEIVKEKYVNASIRFDKNFVLRPYSEYVESVLKKYEIAHQEAPAPNFGY